MNEISKRIYGEKKEREKENGKIRIISKNNRSPLKVVPIAKMKKLLPQPGIRMLLQSERGPLGEEKTRFFICGSCAPGLW